MSSMLWRAVSESAVSGVVREAVDRPRTPVRPGDLSPGNADDVSSPERENNLSNQALTNGPDGLYGEKSRNFIFECCKLLTCSANIKWAPGKMLSRAFESHCLGWLNSHARSIQPFKKNIGREQGQ